MVPKDFLCHNLPLSPIERDNMCVMWCPHLPTNDCDTGCSQYILSCSRWCNPCPLLTKKLQQFGDSLSHHLYLVPAVPCCRVCIMALEQQWGVPNQTDDHLGGARTWPQQINLITPVGYILPCVCGPIAEAGFVC